MIKVSVIIPAYNVENYIEECITSVLEQTVKEIEVIVVDDGSIDTTIDKLQDFQKQDNRIQIIQQENAGPGVARNKALEYAVGEYIFFLDGDDTLPKDTCEVLYRQAKVRDADILIGKMIWKKNETYTDVIYNQYWFNDKMDFDRDYKCSIAIVTGLPTVTARLIKTDLIKRNNIQFPSYLGEDMAFWLFIWHKANSIYLINKVVYYRTEREEEHNKSITQTISLQVIEDKLNIVDICMGYCRDNRLEGVDEKILYNLRSILELILILNRQEDQIRATKAMNQLIKQYKISDKLFFRLTLCKKKEFDLLDNQKMDGATINRRRQKRVIIERNLRKLYRLMRG